MVRRSLAFKHLKVQRGNEEQSSVVFLKCVLQFTFKLCIWMGGFDSPGCFVQVSFCGPNCHVRTGECVPHRAPHYPIYGAFWRTPRILSCLLNCFFPCKDAITIHISIYSFFGDGEKGRAQSRFLWTFVCQQETLLQTLTYAQFHLETHRNCQHHSCALKESPTTLVFLFKNPAPGVMCLWSKPCWWLRKKVWTCCLKHLYRQLNTSLENKY